MPSILIVDDEPHIRLLLEQTLEELEDEGVELIFADNGEKAYEIICDMHPELVFLDVMMPKMSGFEVCSKIKKEHNFTDVHIILLTAKGQEFDKEKGKESGADIYLTKPFNPDDIIDKARQILQL